MSNSNLPSCNLLLLTGHCFVLWLSSDSRWHLCDDLQTALGGYSNTPAPPLASLGQPAPLTPLQKSCSRLLRALAANAEGSEQSPSVTALGYSLVWPRWSLQPPWPPSSCHVPGTLLQQWALLLDDDILHAKATLHCFAFQSCFPCIFLGLRAKRLSRPSPALTPAYIFHCIFIMASFAHLRYLSVNQTFI